MKKHKSTIRAAGLLHYSKLIVSLILVAFLPVLTLPACSQDTVKTTSTLGPTVISPVLSPTPSSAQPTQLPTEPPHDLQPLADFGSFSSGHTLQLPAGVWLDIADSGTLKQINDLVVTTEGQGRPTLSRVDEDQPLLTLQDCTSITFRQVRFGYDRPDWPDQVQTDTIALIELINSKDIRFEDCEFFGGAGPALLLNGAENIVLQNCTFYNQAGPPLVTGDASLPSQIRASDTFFETVTSGRLALYVRDSSFDRCVWVGRKGYQVPVSAADCQAADPAVPLQQNNLPYMMQGILAGRIHFFSDEAKGITVRDNLFTSSEVFALFDRLEEELPDLLPAHAISWSLSGQKAEEARPGVPLDATLGLKLDLRVQIETPVPTALATPAGEEGTPQGTPAQIPEQSSRIYDINRLLADLQGLVRLEGRLDPLLTGNLEAVLHDQHQKPLLTVSLPLDALGAWLDATRPDHLLENGQIVLYNRAIIPADFCLREDAGAFAAAHLWPLLQDALHIRDVPLVIHADETVCFIESKLLFLGTEISGLAAEHHFVHQVIWTTSQDMPPEQDSTQQVQTTFTISADTAGKTLTDSDGMRRPFQLADMQLAQQIRFFLQQEAITLEQTDGSQIALGTCSAWTSAETDCLPLYLLYNDDERIDLLTILYDPQCRPVIVNLSLFREAESFVVRSASQPFS